MDFYDFPYATEKFLTSVFYAIFPYYCGKESAQLKVYMKQLDWTQADNRSRECKPSKLN